MKHCCWVGLLLGCYSSAWPLSPNYSRRRQCCVTDWTTFHYKYRTDRAKARPQKCCRMCYKHGKQPGSLPLPHCPSQPGLRLEDCYKACHMTRSSATVDGPRDALCQSKCCTTVGTSCTTNQSSGFRASHRRTCNKLCVSRHGTSTVDEFG